MYLSVIAVRCLAHELAARGQRIEPALQTVGIAAHSLDDARVVVDVRSVARLLELVSLETPDGDLGLAIGRKLPLSAAHVLGPLALAMPTLRGALQQLAAFAPLLSDGLTFQLVEQAERARLAIELAPGFPARVGSLLAQALGVLALRFARLSLPGLQLLELGIDRAPPPHAAELAAVFGCPVRYHAGAYYGDFAASVLDTRQAQGDVAMASSLVLAAEQLREAVERPSLGQRLSGRMLVEPTHMPSADSASALGVSPRTLHRWLATEGLRLSGLQREARLQRALQELARPEQSIKEVAERLGYSESAAFVRAFKRWTGLSPGSYRRRLRSERISRR